MSANLERLIRRALIKHVQAPPRKSCTDDPGRVVILLVSAWGMGGTIRAALNLAGYLADHREVEILSVYRRRDESFFGPFPPGFEVTAMDDQRPGHAPRGPKRLVYNWLRKRPSVLVHPKDRLAAEFSLWTDVRLARMLRRRRGILMGTRPGLNLMVAQMQPAGFKTVGLEQMNLPHHDRPLRRAMRSHYRKLDAFVVLTDQDMAAYDEHLKGRVPLTRIPNTVRDMGGAPADLSAKVVLGAGRLRMQKGFDYLIPAWKPIAEKHPDWKLRICGEGRLRESLEAQIAEHGLTGAIEMPGACDMSEAMAEASIFALPSRFEGFPLILLEAMSKRMACVAFDCPTGPADIIDDHRNGIIVPLKDIERLSAGILEMIEDEELRRRCAHAAEETSRAFKMDAIGPLWDEFLDGLQPYASTR